MDGLSDGGGQTLPFEAGQRGVENSFGAAEPAEQFASHTRAETWSQRKRDPTQILVGIGGHREGNAAEGTFAARSLSKAETT
jgi:hypothetical protein